MRMLTEFIIRNDLDILLLQEVVTEQVTGSNNRQEREKFFNVELFYLLRHLPTHCIIGVDFNCVTTPYDCTGAYRPCKALDTILKQYNMKDVWTNTINSRRYTHHTRTSAARLDRIYVKAALYNNKIAATIVAAAFTDHFAMTLRIKLHVSRIRMGRGYWKLNSTLLTVDVINETCKKHWELWNKMRCRYTDTTTWWIR
jgi:endonuclease/exonuclease/phosphatase family metal-dependent hydrolase